MLKTFNSDDIAVVLELEDCTKKEIDLFVKKNKYNIVIELEICKNLSENAVNLLLEYDVKQLARMRFIPLQFAKNNSKTNEVIKKYIKKKRFLN